MLIKHVRRGLSILSNPEKAFSELEKYTLEEIVGYYMLLLVSTSILSGIAFFLFSIAKTVYLDVFVNANIVYGRALNYMLGRSALLIFLYMFIGTFIMFLISVVLKLFLPKIRYITLLKILFLSLTPLLLFAWIPVPSFPLVVWSLFMFVVGIRNHKITEIKKGSIKQRY